MSPLKPSFIVDFLVNTCILDGIFLAARHVWWHRCGFTQPPNRTTSVWLQCKVSRYGDVRDVVGDLRLSELENLGMLLASRLRTTIWCKYHQFPKHSRTTFNWLSVCSCLFIFVYHMLDMLGGDDPTIDNEFVTFSYYPRVWLWNVGRQNHKPEVVQGNCLNKLDEDHTMPHHWRVLCSSSISFRSFRFVASPHKEGMK